MLPNVDQVTRTLISEKGYVETLKINLDEIYVPKEDRSSNNNPTRSELSQDNVDKLRTALRIPDWSEPLPIVKRIPTGKTIGGKTYYYHLIAGFHRFEALTLNDTFQWIFDVYDFTGDPESESDLQALENDKKPQKPLDVVGIANWLGHQVSEGWIPCTEEALNEKVEILQYVHPRTKTAAVALAKKNLGAYTDVTIRTIREIKEHIGNDDNYRKDNRPRYVHSGQLDPSRLEFGWSVKEGYEYEYIMNAIKSYHRDKKPSYFLNHVRTPKTGTVNDSRRKMRDSFINLEKALDSAVKYKNETGSWPWRTESWFRQDNHKDTLEEYWVDKI